MTGSNLELRRQMAALLSTLAGKLTAYIGKGYWSDWHNPALLTERQNNMKNVRSYLNELLGSLSKKEVNEETFKSMQTDIRLKLVDALDYNNQFSIKHGFVHHSYQENRHAGFGIFSSWWHKTWFQSNATQTLEACLSHLDQFEKATKPEKSVINLS